jgi:hypothetical protein
VDDGNNLFEVNSVVNQEISANMRSDLLNTMDMVKAIKRKGNLSAPGPDGLTYPILKIEKERAASMMIELMKMLLKWGKCPICWKRARTILLYKGGDKEAPENWRPISLTNILYRTVFGRFAEVIQNLDGKGVKVFEDEQKGFRTGKAGCLEHNCSVSMIIDDTVSRGNELYIVALDFKDAFGSVPHNLIEYSLRKTGFNEGMINIIVDSYCDSSSNIYTAKGVGNEIKIKRGVKQGCPLSPTLFNLCIDPLLKRLSKYKKLLGYEFGHYLSRDSKIVQAYADDVLLFARDRRGLDKVLQIVEEFLEFTKIEINPDKCTAFKYTGESEV